MYMILKYLFLFLASQGLAYPTTSSKEPHFVGLYDIGEYVYFFFRESAVEYINFGKSIYSWVARVCKRTFTGDLNLRSGRDTGGRNILSNNLASFLKARLNCSIPGEFPFYFNEIQNVYKHPKDERTFYAIFTNNMNGMMGSAICTYSLDSIQEVFNGKSKEQAASSSAWLPVLTSKVSERRPGLCVSDSQTLPDSILNFTRRRPLMDFAIAHDNAKPVFYKRGIIFTCIVIEKIEVDGVSYILYYVGTTEGMVYKLVHWYDRTGERYSNLLDVFEATVPESVRAMEIAQKHKSLYVSSDALGRQFSVVMCINRYETCLQCIRDPYCGWDKDRNECRPFINGVLQDVTNATAGICENYVKSKPLRVHWGQSVPLTCFLHLPYLDFHGLGSLRWFHYTHEKDKHQIRARKDKLIYTTDHLLVIISITESDSGRYDCKLGTFTLCSYNITVDATSQSLVYPTTASKGQMLDASIRDTGGLLVLYFLFDSSGSVGKENFNTGINFAKAIVKKAGISETLNVGVVTYGKKARADVFPLTDGSDEKRFLDKLSTIDYIGGGTATKSALEEVQRMVHGVRNTLDYYGQATQKIKSVVFLITDGIYNSIGNPEEKARQLKDASIEIFVIDLVRGKKGKAQNIELLATSPKHMLTLENDETIEHLVDELLPNNPLKGYPCGVRDHHEKMMQPKISRGKVADIPWPWMAYLNIEILRLGKKFDGGCGGSIIDKWWILTAAHCLVNNSQVKYVLRTVTVGMLNLTGMDSGDRQTKEVDIIIIHENYLNFDNDIALLKLKTPLAYGKFIRRICLPPNIREIGEESFLYKANKKVTVIGFGATEQSIASQKLMEAEITLKNLKECRDDVQHHHVHITERMICAGEAKGTIDSCVGDSGGPLMQKRTPDLMHPDPYWVQIGIVSWGIKGECGKTGHDGYYTYLAMYRDWIDYTMETN